MAPSRSRSSGRKKEDGGSEMTTNLRRNQINQEVTSSHRSISTRLSTSAATRMIKEEIISDEEETERVTRRSTTSRAQRQIKIESEDNSDYSPSKRRNSSRVTRGSTSKTPQNAVVSSRPRRSAASAATAAIEILSDSDDTDEISPRVSLYERDTAYSGRTSSTNRRRKRVQSNGKNESGKRDEESSEEDERPKKRGTKSRSKKVQKRWDSESEEDEEESESSDIIPQNEVRSRRGCRSKGETSRKNPRRSRNTEKVNYVELDDEKDQEEEEEEMEVKGKKAVIRVKEEVMSSDETEFTTPQSSRSVRNGSAQNGKSSTRDRNRSTVNASTVVTTERQLSTRKRVQPTKFDPSPEEEKTAETPRVKRNRPELLKSDKDSEKSANANDGDSVLSESNGGIERGSSIEILSVIRSNGMQTGINDRESAESTRDCRRKQKKESVERKVSTTMLVTPIDKDAAAEKIKKEGEDRTREALHYPAQHNEHVLRVSMTLTTMLGRRLPFLQRTAIWWRKGRGGTWKRPPKLITDSRPVMPYFRVKPKPTDDAMKKIAEWRTEYLEHLRRFLWVRDSPRLNTLRGEIRSIKGYFEDGKPAYQFSVHEIISFRLLGRRALIHSKPFMDRFEKQWMEDDELKSELLRERANERKTNDHMKWFIQSEITSKQEDLTKRLLALTPLTELDGSAVEPIALEENGENETEEERNDEENESDDEETSNRKPFYFNDLRAELGSVEGLTEEDWEIMVDKEEWKTKSRKVAFTKYFKSLCTEHSCQDLRIKWEYYLITLASFRLSVPSMDEEKNPHVREKNALALGTGYPYRDTIAITRLSHPILAGHRVSMVEMHFQVTAPSKKQSIFVNLHPFVNNMSWKDWFSVPVNNSLLPTHPFILDLRDDLFRRMPIGGEVSVAIRVTFSEELVIMGEDGRRVRDKALIERERMKRKHEAIEVADIDQATYYGAFYLGEKVSEDGMKYEYGTFNVNLVPLASLREYVFVEGLRRTVYTPDAMDEIIRQSKMIHQSPFIEFEFFNEDIRCRDETTQSCPIYNGEMGECTHAVNQSPSKRPNRGPAEMKESELIISPTKLTRVKVPDTMPIPVPKEVLLDEKWTPAVIETFEDLNADIDNDSVTDSELYQLARNEPRDRSCLPNMDYVQAFSGHTIHFAFSSVPELMQKIEDGNTIEKGLEDLLDCSLSQADSTQIRSLQLLQQLNFPAVIKYHFAYESDKNENEDPPTLIDMPKRRTFRSPWYTEYSYYRALRWTKRRVDNIPIFFVEKVTANYKVVRVFRWKEVQEMTAEQRVKIIAQYGTAFDYPFKVTSMYQPEKKKIYFVRGREEFDLEKFKQNEKQDKGVVRVRRSKIIKHKIPTRRDMLKNCLTSQAMRNRSRRLMNLPPVETCEETQDDEKMREVEEERKATDEDEKKMAAVDREDKSEEIMEKVETEEVNEDEGRREEIKDSGEEKKDDNPEEKKEESGEEKGQKESSSSSNGSNDSANSDAEKKKKEMKRTNGAVENENGHGEEAAVEGRDDSDDEEPPAKKACVEIPLKTIKIESGGETIEVLAWRPEFGVFRGKKNVVHDNGESAKTEGNRKEATNEGKEEDLTEKTWDLIREEYGEKEAAEMADKLRIACDSDEDSDDEFDYDGDDQIDEDGEEIVDMLSSPGSTVSSEESDDGEDLLPSQLHFEFEMQFLLKIPTIHLLDVDRRKRALQRFLLTLNPAQLDEFTINCIRGGVDYSQWPENPLSRQELEEYHSHLCFLEGCGKLDYSGLQQRWLNEEAVRVAQAEEKEDEKDEQNESSAAPVPTESTPKPVDDDNSRNESAEEGDVQNEKVTDIIENRGEIDDGSNPQQQALAEPSVFIGSPVNEAVRGQSQEFNEVVRRRFGTDEDTQELIQNPSTRVTYKTVCTTRPNECIFCQRKCPHMFALMMHYNMVHIRFAFKIIPNIKKNGDQFSDEITIQIALDAGADTTIELLDMDPRIDKPPECLTHLDVRRSSKPVKMRTTNAPIFLSTRFEFSLLGNTMCQSMLTFTREIGNPSALRRLTAERLYGPAECDMSLYDHSYRAPGAIGIVEFASHMRHEFLTQFGNTNSRENVDHRGLAWLLHYFNCSLDVGRCNLSHYFRLRMFLRCNLHIILYGLPLGSVALLDDLYQYLKHLVDISMLSWPDYEDLILRIRFAIDSSQRDVENLAIGFDGNVDMYDPLRVMNSPLRREVEQAIYMLYDEANDDNGEFEYPFKKAPMEMSADELSRAVNFIFYSEFSIKLRYQAANDVEVIFSSKDVAEIPEWMFVPENLMRLYGREQASLFGSYAIPLPPNFELDSRLGRRPYSAHYYKIRVARKREDRSHRDSNLQHAILSRYYERLRVAEATLRPPATTHNQTIQDDPEEGSTKSDQ